MEQEGIDSMSVIGIGTETYLYLNGIAVSREVVLRDGIVLLPVTSDFHFGTAAKLLENDVDFAVTAVSGRSIAAQMRITAADARELATVAWNAGWDCILLGAIFHSDVMFNIQCDKPVEHLEHAKYVHVTNYQFRAILAAPYQLTTEDEKWIHSYYSSAHKLLDKDVFMTAAHAMATHTWHSMPRVQLAILWSGIEALFEASTEISFRISLYIANFLAGDDTAEANNLFAKIRKLYVSRSAAVHGGKIKGDLENCVAESASLLNRIIRRCAERGELPDTKHLVFPHDISRVNASGSRPPNKETLPPKQKSSCRHPSKSKKP